MKKCLILLVALVWFCSPSTAHAIEWYDKVLRMSFCTYEMEAYNDIVRAIYYPSDHAAQTIPTDLEDEYDIADQCRDLLEYWEDEDNRTGCTWQDDLDDDYIVFVALITDFGDEHDDNSTTTTFGYADPDVIQDDFEEFQIHGAGLLLYYSNQFGYWGTKFTQEEPFETSTIDWYVSLEDAISDILDAVFPLGDPATYPAVLPRYFSFDSGNGWVIDLLGSDEMNEALDGFGEEEIPLLPVDWGHGDYYRPRARDMADPTNTDGMMYGIGYGNFNEGISDTYTGGHANSAISDYSPYSENVEAHPGFWEGP